jgi:type I restriction enzyme, S subunit
MSKIFFKDIVIKDKGFLRGPFGGDLKKEIFVPKSDNTYKVYEQGVVLQGNEKIGDYYVSEEYFQEKMHRFEVKPKDFLVSCSGVNYGAIYQLGENIEKGIINQALLRIRLNNKVIDDNYFFYLFKHHIVNMIVGKKGDSTIPNFPPLSTIKELKFLLPSIIIQKPIGNLLRKIDIKIELNNRINADLESLAKTIYDYWFVQFDFPNADGKPYKSSSGEMVYVEGSDRAIPAGWEIGTLRDLVEFNYGKPLKTEVRTGSGYPVVGSSGVIGYHSEFLIEASGVVVGRKGTIGAITYLHENFYPIDTTYYVKPRKKIKLIFIFFLLQTLRLDRMNGDSAVPGLNRDVALNVPISLPPLELIQKFESSIDSMFNKKKNIQRENQQLTQLRDWLLPMLMNGQVSIK